ncbi:MAG: type II toxin-antitoxin system prevent-host-death family antitoxin [Myxococcales bacterium]|nr:type II toxin-antitoxin system prevent-host-death family antitoxin [Myxococcales bacterium]
MANRILLVDDSIDDLEAVEVVLRRAGFTVRLANPQGPRTAVATGSSDVVVGSAAPAPRIRRQAREVTATEAKNEFASILDTAVSRGPVVIRKHDAPRAVLVSWTEFEAMEAPGRRLDTLTAQYEARLAAMQRPGMRERMRAAFDADPAELAAAAVGAARGER